MFYLAPSCFFIHPSRRQEVANVLSASAPVSCPQCQSQLVVELEANPDGVEAKAAELPSSTVSDGVKAEPVNDAVGEEHGEEVARISWVGKSDAKEVPSSHALIPGTPGAVWPR